MHIMGIMTSMASMGTDIIVTDVMALVATTLNTDNFNTMLIMDMATAATGVMDPVAMVTTTITGKISP